MYKWFLLILSWARYLLQHWQFSLFINWVWRRLVNQMEAQKGCLLVFRKVALGYSLYSDARCSDNSGCCFSGCMSNGMVVWLTQYFQWLILFQRLLLHSFWGRFLSSIGCYPKDSSGWLNVSIGFNFSSSSFIVSSGSVVSLFEIADSPFDYLLLI